MKKVAITLALGALGVALAQSGSRSTYTGPKVEITYVHGFTASDRSIKEELIKRFNAAHPNIVVKGQAVPWGTTWQQLPSLVSAGRAADVLTVTEDVIGNFMARGVFSEITPAEVTAAGIKPADYYPALWKGSEYNGKQYGVPFSQVAMVMFYNQDLLTKSGVSAAPATRQQFLDAAQKCTTDRAGKRPGQASFDAKNLATYGANVNTGGIGWFLAYGILRSNGGNVADAKGEPAFNTPEARETLQFMSDLVNRYNVSRSGLTEESAIADFRAGRACFNFTGAWQNTQYKGIKEFKYGIAAVPQLGTKRPAFWAAFQAFMMPKQRANYDKNKRAAALEFARWMTLPEQSLYWTAASGALPILPAVARSKEYQSGSEFAKVAAALDNGYVPGGPAWLPQILNPWYAAIDSVVLGKKAVAKALDDGVAESKKLVQQARQTLPK